MKHVTDQDLKLTDFRWHIDQRPLGVEGLRKFTGSRNTSAIETPTDIDSLDSLEDFESDVLQVFDQELVPKVKEKPSLDKQVEKPEPPPKE